MSAGASGLGARGLAFQYPGGPLIIDDWTETFEPGQITAITGASGTGNYHMESLTPIAHASARPDTPH